LYIIVPMATASDRLSCIVVAISVVSELAEHTTTDEDTAMSAMTDPEPSQ